MVEFDTLYSDDNETKKYCVEQAIAIIKARVTGRLTMEVCRRHEISSTKL